MEKAVVEKKVEKIDFEAIVEKLTEEYKEAVGDEDIDELDYDVIFDFVRGKNDEQALPQYDEYDYPQAVMEKLIEEQAVYQPHQSPLVAEDKHEVKKKKKVAETESSQGNLSFSCKKGLLRDLSKKIRVTNDDGKLVFNEQGMTCRVVDDGHVLMLGITLPRTEFYVGHDCINKQISYIIDKPLEIGMDLNELDGFLKLCDAYDTIHASLNDKEITFETHEDKPVRKKMKPLYVEGLPDPKVPNLKYVVKAEVKRNELSILKKACSGTTQSSLTSSVSSVDKVQLIANGKTLKAVVTDFDEESELTIMLSKDVTGEGKAYYSCDYITRLLSAVSGEYNVFFNFSTDNPLKVSGEIGTKGEFWYLLAPRIQEE